MQNVWKRVNESGKNWRIVYKALTLLEYLIRNGSERSVEDGRDHIYQVIVSSHSKVYRHSV